MKTGQNQYFPSYHVCHSFYFHNFELVFSHDTLLWLYHHPSLNSIELQLLLSFLKWDSRGGMGVIQEQCCVTPQSYFHTWQTKSVILCDSKSSGNHWYSCWGYKFCYSKQWYLLLPDQNWTTLHVVKNCYVSKFAIISCLVKSKFSLHLLLLWM